MPGIKNDLREALQEVYGAEILKSSKRVDVSDHGYIGVHLIERSIARLASRVKGDMIDVGCGQQPYRNYFSHISRIVACDFDAGRGNVDFSCPAHAIPVPPESFDTVLCTEVLEHVPDPLAVWQEFYRILRRGGQVLLTTPMYWPPHELPYDFYRYPEHGLRYLAITAGFEIRELLPRGGRWAMLGQVGMHALSRQMQLSLMRRIWNRTFLWIDRQRNNPDLTLGWTVLAQKPG